MGATFVINAPMIFSAVWAIIKGFLDEKTRSKIIIKGTDYLETILEHVDKENLPKFLGGTCECEGGCLKRQPGPWDDYELVGREIRLKSEEVKVEDNQNDNQLLL